MTVVLPLQFSSVSFQLYSNVNFVSNPPVAEYHTELISFSFLVDAINKNLSTTNSFYAINSFLSVIAFMSSFEGHKR